MIIFLNRGDGVDTSNIAPRKSPSEGGFQFNPMIVDQAAINADFDFRR
jgi:hypothetical protein